MRVYFKVLNINLKESTKNYLIYFITILFASSLFFAFLTLSSPNNLFLTSSELYDHTLFTNIIEYSIYSISLVLIFLIIYVNNYIFSKRVSELFIYMILGMQNVKIAFLFFCELFIVGILAVLAGIVLGHFISSLLISLVTLIVSDFIQYQFVFYGDIVIRTLIFFSITFAFIGLIYAFKISKYTLIQLWTSNKKTEGKKINKVLCIVCLIIASASYFYAGINVRNYFILGRTLEGNIPYYESNAFQLAIFFSLVVGIFSTYYAMVYIFYFIKMKNKSITYKKNNIILMCNILSKIYTNARIMGGITICIILAIGSSVLMPVLSQIAEGYLEYRTQFEISIFNPYSALESIDDIPHIDYSFVDKILQENNVEIKESVQVEKYFISPSDFNNMEDSRNVFNYPSLAISLTDYNQLRKMKGYDPIYLSNNEFAMHLDYELDRDEVLQSMSENHYQRQLDIDNVFYLDESRILKDNLGAYVFHATTPYVLVFPDYVTQSFTLASTAYFVDTINPIDFISSNELIAEIKSTFRNEHYNLYEKYEGISGSIDFIQMRFRTTETNSVMQLSLSLRLLAIYMPLIFLMVCFTIISLQQLIDSREKKEIYHTLYKIGLDKKQIYKLINKQIICFFIVPITMSIIMLVVIFHTFNIRFGHKIGAYLSGVEYLYSVYIAFFLLIIVFSAYFISTIYIYRNNIISIFGK